MADLLAVRGRPTHDLGVGLIHLDWIRPLWHLQCVRRCPEILLAVFHLQCEKFRYLWLLDKPEPYLLLIFL